MIPQLLGIRPVVLEDETWFMARLREYLGEMVAKGSEVMPTDRTVEYFRELFRSAAMGRSATALGVVKILIRYPVAFTIAREVPFPYDTTFGRTAVGLGSYVAPGSRRKGIAKALRRKLLEELRGEGFQTLLGMVGAQDEEALASITGLAQAHQILIRADLGTAS